MKRRGWKWLVIGGAAVMVAFLVWVRARTTAEYMAVFGTAKQRADICRVLPSLHPARRKPLLARLLSDPLETVRISAIAAAGRSEPRPELDDILEQTLGDPAASPDVRTKAAEVLLSRRPVRSSVVEHLRLRCSESEFRREHPLLVAHLAAWELLSAGRKELRALLFRCLDRDEPARDHLRRLVLDNAGAFGPLRGELALQLNREMDFATRQFVLACLSAIEGGMRGQSAADWLEGPLVATGEDTFCAFEAEWVQDLRPNYQIGEVDGYRCLVLKEGGGGNMDWLKGLDGTVDIGSGRFSIWVPRDGTYRLWVRTYMDDKCGNSFGIWIDDHTFTNFYDRRSTLGTWHWLPLRSTGGRAQMHLSEGLHSGRLQAWEDGIYLDKFVLLPADRRPDVEDIPSAPRWDTRLLSCLSLSVQMQSQVRGTTQTVTAWVRRNSPALTRGELRLEVPRPFRIIGPERSAIRFSEGNPLARTSFRIELPADVPAGEGIMRAEYRDASGEVVEGRMVLGGQLDWLTSGPLEPRDPRNDRLSRAQGVNDQELRELFRPFPARGYDMYRRLDMERAFGQLQHRFVCLCADIEVARDGRYLALLTADDTAHVFIDGRPAIAQPEPGPGEGRLVQRPIRLSAGRHRIFARVYQSHLPDPRGSRARYEPSNRCNFKLLLRRDRHEPAPEIRGLPMAPLLEPPLEVARAHD